jgi:SAM-dependent methyltransferase
MTMQGYRPESYGERVADLYDEWYADLPETDECVERLAELARAGPVLELGVGTGRLALPLAERGLEVHGIDNSTAMLAELAAKPGGDRVHATVGDFAEVDVEGRFPLIFVAVNTLFLLPTQEQQVRCFQTVAEHLADDGVFVVDVFLPDLSLYDHGQSVRVQRLTSDGVVLTVAQHDLIAQQIQAQQLLLRADRIRLVPGVLRYAWPAELDLMARLAGLRLRERWGGWRREPFTAASRSHVSLYERA